MGWMYVFVLILAQIQLCSSGDAKYYVPKEAREIPCREPECVVQVTPAELTYTFNGNGLHQMAFTYTDTEKIIKLDFDFNLADTGEASYELKFEQDFTNTLKIKKGTNNQNEISFDEVKLCDVEAKFVLTIDFVQMKASCDASPTTTAPLTQQLKDTIWENGKKVADFWISFNVDADVDSKIKLQKNQILYSDDFKPEYPTTTDEMTTTTVLTTTTVITSTEAVITEVTSTEKSFDATFPVYAYVIIAGSILFFVVVVVVLNVIFIKC